MSATDLLPKFNEPVRFAVGHPQGLTSNSWRVWIESSGLYIACRDNFQQTKVSLHKSGRWRMGFTQEAVAKRPNLLRPGQDRAWTVWDKPPITLPETVVAFKLVFVTSELAVSPEQRRGHRWKDVIFVEAGPPGLMTVATLFITLGTPALQPEDGSYCIRLGVFDVGDDRFAQLVMHGDAEANFRPTVERCREAGWAQAVAAGVSIPPEAYGYFLGKMDNGCRYLYGARMDAPAS